MKEYARHIIEILLEPMLIEKLTACVVVFLLLWALVSFILFPLLGSKLWRIRKEKSSDE